MKFRLKLTRIYILILLIIFSVFRLALFFVAHSFFQDLFLWEIICSFLQGLRFDIFTICTFCSAFLFLINIPVDSKIFIKINCAFLSLFIFVSSFLLAADVIHFKLFEKHLTTEVLLIKNHFSYFLSLAFGDYIFITIANFLFIILLFYFSFKIIDKYYVPANPKILLNTVVLLLFGFVMIVAVRGGVQERILSISDAYSQNLVSGELKLNGIFTSLISVRSKTMSNKIDISDSEALKVVETNLLDAGEEIIPNKQYPLMRQRVKFNVDGKDYNIVFILLESWQRDYIDSIAGTSYGVTPNFDILVNNSIVFDNFYANGQRSIMGLMSVFFSLPYVKGIPYMGYGLENSGQTRLPAILTRNGYNNVFVQGDKRESDNAITLANYLGFNESYGKQDIPVEHKYLSISKGYDIEGLAFFFEKVRLLKRPFFAFYFTTTTHIPYTKTILKSLEKYPADGTEKTGYLNRLYYSDYALGEFFKKVKNEEWFDKTIFIMCADHQAYGVGGVNGTFEKTKVDKTFKVPAIIYCPSLFKPVKVSKLSSQFDIVPTIIDILNIGNPYSSLGKSLFSKSKNRFVFLSYEGEQVYLINNDGVATQDWKENPDKTDFENVSNRLLFSIEKTVYNLITKDNWYDRKNLN
ncbi:MAG: sulfatase-like hydrolase/transferase [Endomicrobium sp.]|jgi:phosphoglycerol transferase MdoB-like AlkP superfamily enzyme|nr:sulfatase-like hydrolase/transferase [Endomicrobium sp.]